MLKVKPILFNTEMVRAILDGRKTVTRRIIMPHNQKKAKEQGYFQENGLWVDPDKDNWDKDGHIKDYSISPCWMSYRWYIGTYAPYRPGDILYVRETWFKDVGRYMYKADYSSTEKFYKEGKETVIRWRPSIHMPKEAARIWLKVTNVRVEQIKNMTLDDFLCEGITLPPEAYNDPENAYQQAKGAFVELIKRIYPNCTEDSWFWVIEFERCEKPGRLVEP